MIGQTFASRQQMRKALEEADWSEVPLTLGDQRVIIGRVCPWCLAMVPANMTVLSPDAVMDAREGHIRYHEQTWQSSSSMFGLF